MGGKIATCRGCSLANDLRNHLIYGVLRVHMVSSSSQNQGQIKIELREQLKVLYRKIKLYAIILSGVLTTIILREWGLIVLYTAITKAVNIYMK